MGEIDGRRIHDTVLTDRLGPGIDGIGKGLGSGPAVGLVVFDSEITVRAARIVAGRKDDAAKRLPLADHRTGCGCGQNAPLPNQHPTKPSCCGHTQDDLDGLIVEVSTVTAHHQGLPDTLRERIENGLNVIFKITRLAKYLDLFTQTGGTGFLAGDGGSAYGNDRHEDPGSQKCSVIFFLGTTQLECR